MPSGAWEGRRGLGVIVGIALNGAADPVDRRRSSADRAQV